MNHQERCREILEMLCTREGIQRMRDIHSSPREKKDGRLSRSRSTSGGKGNKGTFLPLTPHIEERIASLLGKSYKEVNALLTAEGITVSKSTVFRVWRRLRESLDTTSRKMVETKTRGN